MRTTTLYLGMLALLLVGTFATLRAGSKLRAVRDLSGTWVVVEGPGERLHVQQSGRYLRLSIDEVGELRLRWEELGDGSSTLLGKMLGDGLELHLHALPPAEEDGAPASRRAAPTHRLEARGSFEASWTLQRAAETSSRSIEAEAH